ncbi:hypothetical protein TW81_02215 [Vibrio galatheae]|uniref:Uncharacterized protein n=1 Tax=Vibrio galatheae TaxID=579748 RepID=A0A0F4NPK6_9VIBR|nr:hypothetical protein [Vibrio galatheae]KJY84829.1 hypothetical protein TW81_02215 [Vibrio galatheae]
MSIASLERDEIKAKLNELAVEYKDKAGTDVLRKKLADALGEPMGESIVNPDEVASQGADNNETVVIQIASTERDKHPVRVGLNGKMYHIERDKEVSIPKALLEILDNAIETNYANEGTEEKPKLVARDSKRFVYSVKG